MRLATWNIEWFNTLFDAAGQPLSDDGWSARRDVTRSAQAGAVARVMARIDADAIMVIEAPDDHPGGRTVRTLEAFAARAGIRARRAVIGFANDTQQEIALLYDPDVVTARHDPGGRPSGGTARADGRDAPRFDDTFHIDLDVDATEDRVVFSKPPLELALTTRGGTALRLIGAHLKSKAPHGATGRDAVMRVSIANRRKQLAQAIWLRRRIDAVLAGGDDLVVMGDLNDGPGLDEYENLFGRSSVEIVMGEGEGALTDPHVTRALDARLHAAPTTSRFFIAHEGRYLQALLDYILVSPGLAARAPRWRIWHPFDDPECWGDADLRDALLTASDHFPVTLDIDA